MKGFLKLAAWAAIVATTVVGTHFNSIHAGHPFDDVCESEETCGQYGTSIVFADSPAEAAKRATQDEKLVFVLHVSGNFETPDYT